MWDGLAFWTTWTCGFSFFLIQCASVVPIVSIGVPLDAWLNPEDVLSSVE